MDDRQRAAATGNWPRTVPMRDRSRAAGRAYGWSAEGRWLSHWRPAEGRAYERHDL